MTKATAQALFPLGQVVSTPGAIHALMEEGMSLSDLLIRHVSGDWGDLCQADRRENALSLDAGLRILSSYRLPRTGVTLWLITEADRSATTFLLPTEY